MHISGTRKIGFKVRKNTNILANFFNVTVLRKTELVKLIKILTISMNIGKKNYLMIYLE